MEGERAVASIKVGDVVSVWQNKSSKILKASIIEFSEDAPTEAKVITLEYVGGKRVSVSKKWLSARIKEARHKQVDYEGLKSKALEKLRKRNEVS